MVELIDNKGEKVIFTIRGKGYNVMTQRPDNYGYLKLDLVVEDKDELAKLKEIQDRYGINIKNELGYAGMEAGKPLTDVNAISLRKKYVEGGKYPTRFIPTTDTNGEVIRDDISHGADLEVTFKGYSYPAGKSDDGFAYKAGNSFQLEKVKVHSYEPFERSSSEKSEATGS